MLYSWSNDILFMVSHSDLLSMRWPGPFQQVRLLWYDILFSHSRLHQSRACSVPWELANSNRWRRLKTDSVNKRPDFDDGCSVSTIPKEDGGKPVEQEAPSKSSSAGTDIGGSSDSSSSTPSKKEETFVLALPV